MKIQRCHGIRVLYDEGAMSGSIQFDRARWWWPWRVTLYPCLCESRGIWPLNRIVVGRAFFAFPPREQQAMLLHEVGHVKLRHVAERARALWKVVLRPQEFAALCRRQEFEADAFAAHCGYASELAQAFGRIKAASGPLHPPVLERIARLVGT